LIIWLGDDSVNIQIDEAVLGFMDEKGKDVLTLLLRKSGGG